MRSYLFLLLPLLGTALARAQQKMSCCAPSATEAFSLLGSDKQFVNSHANPLPFAFKSDNGRAISFRAADGAEAYGWEIRSPEPTTNYLFVIHEWWGLNDYIKQETEKLWRDIGHVHVIAIDLYDKKIAATQEDAARLMQGLDNARLISILKGAISYVGPKARIYTIGWCFGGGWSLQTSLMAGNQAAGCVMYYGMPEKGVEKLKTLHAAVLGIFANKDQHINTLIVDEFAANMTKAGKELTLKRYDADHAFANPSNPSFDKAAKEDAYKATLGFLKARIR